MKLPISLFKRADDVYAENRPAREKLRECAARIHAHGHRMIEDCLAIGKELVAAREITRGAWQGGSQEGEWRNFLAEQVKMPRRQAQRFIDVYEKYGTGVPRGTPLPDTSFRVLAELAAPEADPEVVAELEEKIAKGERVTVRQATRAKKSKATSARRDCVEQPVHREQVADLKQSTPTPKSKGASRAARWADACASASAALECLVELQGDYSAWRENLPENFAASVVADKLDVITEIDLQSAIDIVNEAAGADLPMGFGRD
ncbi:MAG: DUF3102 domain-containing protein [Betaproteobacteria bacterium]|nr:DUF3102 domain-containing protein [Betaproteobacteria bacterium]